MAHRLAEFYFATAAVVFASRCGIDLLERKRVVWERNVADAAVWPVTVPKEIAKLLKK